MSVSRSIDRADLAGASVTLTGSTETVVLVGPMLQTPKDTSMVIVYACLNISVPTSCTSVILRVRQGATAAGAQLGQPYTVSSLTVAQSLMPSFMVSYPSIGTDYTQVCLTAQAVSATSNSTVNAATLVTESF